MISRAISAATVKNWIASKGKVPLSLVFSSATLTIFTPIRKNTKRYAKTLHMTFSTIFKINSNLSKDLKYFLSNSFSVIFTFFEQRSKKVFSRLHIVSERNTENTIRNIKAIPLLKPSFSVYI